MTAILNASGKPVDAAQVTAVVNSLKGKQVHEVHLTLFSSLLPVSTRSVQSVEPPKQPPLPRKPRRRARRKSPRPRSLNPNPRTKTSILICSVELI